MSQKQFTIAIAGSYLGHGGNIGDEANHAAIAQGVEDLGIACRIVLLSRVPQRHLYGPIYTLKPMTPEFLRWYEEEVDLLVVSGGGVIEPGDMSMQALLKPLEATGVPMAWFAINAQWAQNYTLAERDSIIETLQRAAHISARNKASKDFLDSLESGVNVERLPDSTFLLRPQPTFTELPPLKLYAFNLRATWSDPKVLGQLAAVADRLIEEDDATIVFLPFSHLIYDVDLNIFQAFRSACKHSDRILAYPIPETPSRMIHLLSRFECIVTARLHGMVLSQIAGVPYAAIDCHLKMRAFMEEHGLEDRSIVTRIREGNLAHNGYGYDPNGVNIDTDLAVERIRAVRKAPMPDFSSPFRGVLQTALEAILGHARARS
jgi:polysaccharide pyruvyl transferase WcaK-like protein